jgi:HK97 gp10 family phage protein
MAGNRYKVPIYATVDASSLEDTIRRLKDVDRKAARKAIRKGINEITKLILAAARAGVPQRTGQLRRSLGRKVRSTKDGSGIYGVVKPRSGVRVKGQWVAKFRKDFTGSKNFPNIGMVDPVKYAHLVEHGRASVTRKRKRVLAGGGVVWGTRVRAVAPRPFMRPAWEQYRPLTPSILKRFLDEEIRNYWTRSRGRGR